MLDIKEIRKLSVEERIELVESIWDSIAEDTNPEDFAISEVEKDEIIKRYKDFKKGGQKTYSWEQVKQFLAVP